MSRGSRNVLMSFSTTFSFYWLLKMAWVSFMVRSPPIFLLYCFLSKTICSSRIMYSFIMTTSGWKASSDLKKVFTLLRSFHRFFFSKLSISCYSWMSRISFICLSRICLLLSVVSLCYVRLRSTFPWCSYSSRSMSFSPSRFLIFCLRPAVWFSIRFSLEPFSLSFAVRR